jgi:hypothetical protein
MPSLLRTCSQAVSAGPMFRARRRPASERRMAPSFADRSFSPTSARRTTLRRRDRSTRPVATKNAAIMMRTSVGTIDAASALTCDVANHRPMCGAANRLMYAGLSDPMSAGASAPSSAEVNGPTSVAASGPTTAATEIVVVDPTPASAMAATTCCRMANAGLSFGAERRPRLDSNQALSNGVAGSVQCARRTLIAGRRYLRRGRFAGDER